MGTFLRESSTVVVLARICVMVVAKTMCHVVKKRAGGRHISRYSSYCTGFAQHCARGTYGNLVATISLFVSEILRDGVYIPKCAVASTHLLKRMTLELMAIQRLLSGQRLYPHTRLGIRSHLVRDEDGGVKAGVRGRRSCNTTRLELPLIVIVLVLGDGRHGEIRNGTGSAGGWSGLTCLSVCLSVCYLVCWLLLRTIGRVEREKVEKSNQMSSGD